MFTPFFEPTREDEGNEEEEAEREVVMVERWRVETVEALWLKTVFDGCAKGYKIEPIPGLMDRLLNVKVIVAIILICQFIILRFFSYRDSR